MNASSIGTLAVSLTICGAAAQTASFDVAALKLRKGAITFSADPSVRGRTVSATASTLRDMLTYAYHVRYDQLAGGPAWIGDDHYDLEAKSEGEGVLMPAQSRQMMQSLLAERFHLQVHRESRETPIYALVVAKSGPKLKAAAPDAAGGFTVRAGNQGMRMECSRCTLEQLARQLGGSAGRVVIDRTGLHDLYAFTLEWLPANGTEIPEFDAPTVFSAVKELGLRLEPIKGAIEMLVIDRAERPSEN